MNRGGPKSDYAKLLDSAVKEIKQSEERRREYMSIYANAGDLIEVGDYKRVVRTIRNNRYDLPDDVLAGTLEIAPKTLQNVRFVINEHPDWDDEDVAEEVLDLEDD